MTVAAGNGAVGTLTVDSDSAGGVVPVAGVRVSDGRAPACDGGGTGVAVGDLISESVAPRVIVSVVSVVLVEVSPVVMG